MIKLACYHAHHSNIVHIERALASYNVELVHFVDPGLDRMKNDADFTQDAVQRKIKDTLAWISRCHVDAILITCTFFTANLADAYACPIPIIKIDDPLLQLACESSSQPAVMVFTNPATVEGTMDHLQAKAIANGIRLQAEAIVLENTFELIMRGDADAVSQGLAQAAAERPDALIIAAQLSMVPAAQRVQERTGRRIGNHLDSLASFLLETIGLS